MILGYRTSDMVFWVERSEVKVRIRVRVNSNTVWVQTLWVHSSCQIRC